VKHSIAALLHRSREGMRGIGNEQRAPPLGGFQAAKIPEHPTNGEPRWHREHAIFS
jgi:hypothetical protein